jgi:dethiobiotin synthetase
VWRESSDVVVVEGAGGLFSPLGDTLLNCDLARHLALPLVIVDAARLGTIGRTLATVRAARAEGLRVVAVVLSQIAPAEGGTGPVGDDGIARDGAAEIAARLPNVPVAVLPHAQATEVPLIDWSIAAGCQRLRCGE